MPWMIELLETAPTLDECQQMLDALRSQVGYRGGRLLPASASTPENRVQAFFDDAPEATWLPDGLRRVIIPNGQQRALGIDPDWYRQMPLDSGGR